MFPLILLGLCFFENRFFLSISFQMKRQDYYMFCRKNSLQQDLKTWMVPGENTILLLQVDNTCSRSCQSNICKQDNPSVKSRLAKHMLGIPTNRNWRESIDWPLTTFIPYFQAANNMCLNMCHHSRIKEETCTTFVKSKKPKECRQYTDSQVLRKMASDDALHSQWKLVKL